MPVPYPRDEPQRLETLASFRLLDSAPEPAFEAITALASFLFQMPVALLTLLDEDRQWFKSKVGVPYGEMSREDAICSYTILSAEGLVIPDTIRDERTAENRFVIGKPWFRFYAGMPLLTSTGMAIGTLCVLDTRPRYDFDDRSKDLLRSLAQEAMAHAQLRRSSCRLVDNLLARRTDLEGEELYCHTASAIADAADLHGAWREMLTAFCRANNWLEGRAWVNGDDFICIAGGEKGDILGELPAGFALQAWERGEPVLEPAPEGESCRLAIPIREEDESGFVLEFGVRDADEAGPEVIAQTGAIARRLGRLLAQKGSDEALRLKEAELARRNEIKDHFLAMLAHELRNPLAPILNAVALLRSPDPGDSIAIIERQVHHMARLMEDLLDISRITQGKLVMRKRPIDLLTPVQSAIRTMTPFFKTRGQQMQLALPETPLPIEADPVRLEQVVSNLLQNAAKYSGPEGVIQLEVWQEQREAFLRVKDNGYGIVPEMLGNIFEPFVQGGHPHSGSGLGIGLALVRQIVELHGGRIEAKSRGLGQGATFTVTLPMGDVSLRDEEAPSSSIREEVSASPRRVLLVEDNRDLVATLKRLLAHWGHEVVAVSRGRDALKEALACRPDFALIDIGLPGEIDGYAVAKELVAAPELAGVRLIAVTGYSHQKDRLTAEDSGFDDYLLKPVDPERLKRLFSEG